MSRVNRKVRQRARSERAPSDAREYVRRQFGDPFDRNVMDAASFHLALQTPELRSAYVEEFRAEYFDVCGFIHAPVGLSTVLGSETETEGCFKRFQFEAYLRKYRPPLFELPDLSAYAPEESRGYDHEAREAFYKRLQTERAKWFVSCQLPLTETERAWLADVRSDAIDKPTRDLLSKAKACPADSWEAQHAPANWKYHPPWRESFARLLQEAKDRLAPSQPEKHSRVLYVFEGLHF